LDLRGREYKHASENCIRRSLKICLFTKDYSGDETKEDEMDMVCDTNGEEERCGEVFSWQPEGKGPLGTLRCRWEDSILK